METFYGLDVIIVDDDHTVSEMLARMVERFYTWGEVHFFSDPDEAFRFCMDRQYGIAIFIVDVFLGGRTGFRFLDSLSKKYASIHEDAIIVTGSASGEVVEMCLDSDVNYLLEKPIKRYALQLAVRSIATKYIRFAMKMQTDPEFAEWLNKIRKRYFSQLPRLPKERPERF